MNPRRKRLLAAARQKLAEQAELVASARRKLAEMEHRLVNGTPITDENGAEYILYEDLGSTPVPAADPTLPPSR